MCLIIHSHKTQLFETSKQGSVSFSRVKVIFQFRFHATLAEALDPFALSRDSEDARLFRPADGMNEGGHGMKSNTVLLK